MNSMKIGTYQMDTSFGLYLPEYTIPAPTPQTHFVPIIGRDGSVDLSEAIGLHYDSRVWDLDFKCFDPTVNWHTLTSQVMNAIHGKRLNFEFDDDPNYFWTGRISVSSYVSTRGTGTLKVNITSDPFKYAKLSTIVTKNASTGTDYTGAVVSFNTANAKINDLSVTMQPIQDLHGYSSPWPAGGGVNQWDEDWEVGGISSSNGQNLAQNNIRSKGYIPVSAGAEYYVFVTTDTNKKAYIFYYDSNKGYVGSSGAYVRGVLTIPSGTAFIRFQCNTNYGYAGYGNDIAINYPATVTTYSPYSNICPISGRTGLTVYRTGKNLIDQLAQISGTYTQTYYKDVIVNQGHISSFELVAGQTYTLSLDVTSTVEPFSISAGAGNGAYINDIATKANLTSGRNFITFTPTETQLSLGNIFAFRTPRYSTKQDFTFSVSNIQLEYGSPASSYAPYSGSTYAVDWTTQAGTVYGGTLDVVTGVLTVDMVNIPSYNGETINEPWLSSMDAYAAGTTPTIGAQVVYTLATPLTYQLTPQEITTLTGQNNVWSDSGDVSVAVVTPETVTNNGLAVVPTLTASADMVLKWGNYSASVQQGTSTVPQLILENGANLIYIIGTGTLSFAWQEASL